MSQMSRQKHLEGDFTPRSPLPSLSDPNRHLKTLTGLRAIAAAWVVLFHASLLFEVWVPAFAKLHSVTAMGFLGVDLFFALSGFVLCHRYLEILGPRLDRRSIQDFLLLRIARLYPVHLFVLVVFACYVGLMVALSQGTAGNEFSGTYFGQNLVLVHGWFNQPLAWNSPAWSVSLEWLAYLFFPILALVLFRIDKSARTMFWGLLLGIAVYIPLVLHIVHAQSFPVATFPSDVPNSGIVSLNLVRLVAAFGGGCVAFVLARQCQRRSLGPIKPVFVTTIWFITLAIIVAFGRSGFTEQDSRTWLLSPVLVLLVAVTGLGGTFFGWLERPLMIRLGLSSYSLYMTHWFVFSVFGVVPGLTIGPTLARELNISEQGMLARILFCVAAVAMCYIVAYLCWRFIEEPSRRGLRRRFAGSRGELPVEERVDSSAPVTQS